MADLLLKRVAFTDEATYGVLIRDGRPFAVTLELPWLDNRMQKSCIPTGTYLCRRIVSPKHGTTFRVENVPNRSEILFHKGNLPANSLGCILIGESFNKVKGVDGITSSAEGFAEFMAIQKGISLFTLTIG